MDNQLLDILASFSILFIIVGPRFNVWPLSESGKYSGLPKDYVNTSRYYFFYMIYLSVFVMMITVFQSTYTQLGPNLIALTGKTNGFLKVIGESLGFGSITFLLLFLCSLLNKPKINELDNVLRQHLLHLARIPRNVEELKKHLVDRNESFTPNQDELRRCLRYLNRKFENEYWLNIHEHITEEKTQKTLVWKYIKTQYLLYVIRVLNAGSLNPTDIKNRKDWLLTVGKEIPHIHEKNLPEIYAQRNKELSEYMVYFYEYICKHVVKKYPEIERQYIVLKRFGFEPRFSDTKEINLVEPICLSFLGITCATILTFLFLLAARDYYQVPRHQGGQWFSYTRLLSWSAGNLFSYLVVIMIGYIMEKVSESKRDLPNIGVYAIAFCLSTLGSLSYFYFTRDFKLSVGHMCIAFSLGSFVIVVIRSLSRISADRRRDVLISSLQISLVFGCLHALLAVGTTMGFRNTLPAADAATAINLIYGFIKGFSITFIISYSIQESYREQLLASQRSNPRKKHIISMKATSDDKDIRIVTKNISKTGILIQNKEPLTVNNPIKLFFPFAREGVFGKIIWTEGKNTGVSFEKGDPNLPKVHKYIRERFGEFYAI